MVYTMIFAHSSFIRKSIVNYLSEFSIINSILVYV